jgi:hypothetical protein
MPIQTLKHSLLVTLILALGCPFCAFCQDAASLRSIKKIYIEKMPNDLDQYLRAEIVKQFKGSVTVVLDKNDADGILTGIDEERTGTGAQITGRYLGLHDNATGTISLLDKAEKNILWTDEAGDRSLLFGVMKRGGQRKVADRLIAKLKKAMNADAHLARVQPPAVAAPAVPTDSVAPLPVPARTDTSPNPAEPVTISLGQTIAEVESINGKPDKIIDLGAKKIYIYKDLRITFTDGKVSDVQ